MRTVSWMADTHSMLCFPGFPEHQRLECLLRISAQVRAEQALKWAGIRSLGSSNPPASSLSCTTIALPSQVRPFIVCRRLPTNTTAPCRAHPLPHGAVKALVIHRHIDGKRHIETTVRNNGNKSPSHFELAYSARSPHSPISNLYGKSGRLEASRA